MHNSLIFQFFQKELPQRAEADPDNLMTLAYSMKYNAKKMKKLEKEYIIIKTKEQEEMTELKVNNKNETQSTIYVYLSLLAETSNGK